MKIALGILAVTALSLLSFATSVVADTNTGLYQYRIINPTSHDSSLLRYKVRLDCEVVPSVNNVGLGRHTTGLGSSVKVSEGCAIPTFGAADNYGPYAPVSSEFAGEEPRNAGG